MHIAKETQSTGEQKKAPQKLKYNKEKRWKRQY